MMFNNRNVHISPAASLGKNIRIGDNTTVYDNVVIEDNVTIAHDCIIGEPLNDFYLNASYFNPSTVIGANSLIRSHSIIYAGNTLGENVSTGHFVILRENNIIGNHSVIGSFSDIQGNVSIGSYCRIYSNVHISSLSIIKNFVFLYPYVVMTNDQYPPSNDIKGSIISSYTVIGTHSIILAGLKIGENCMVGANSRVSKNIADYSLVNGNLAETIMDVRSYVIVGKGRVYPWMNRFSRGMPWEKIGYKEWIQENEKI